MMDHFVIFCITIAAISAFLMLLYYAHEIELAQERLDRIEAELALVREMRHDDPPTLAEGWQENRDAQNAESE